LGLKLPKQAISPEPLGKGEGEETEGVQDYRVAIIFKRYRILFGIPIKTLEALGGLFAQFILPLYCVEFFVCNNFLDVYNIPCWGNPILKISIWDFKIQSSSGDHLEKYGVQFYRTTSLTRSYFK
jgi:hypothetical protein